MHDDRYNNANICDLFNSGVIPAEQKHHKTKNKKVIGVVGTTEQKSCVGEEHVVDDINEKGHRGKKHPYQVDRRNAPPKGDERCNQSRRNAYE